MGALEKWVRQKMGVPEKPGRQENPVGRGGTWGQKPWGLLTSAPVNVLREMRTLREGVLLLVLLALSVSGCRGAKFDGAEYRDREVAFRLAYVPQELRALSSGEAKVAFQNDRVGSTIAISARCGVDSDDVPLRALVQHLFLQLTERQLISEKEFVLDGRGALQMEMAAYLDGVRRHFVVTVLKKDGCVYDFLHVDGGGSDAALVASRADYRKLVQGFSTLE